MVGRHGFQLSWLLVALGLSLFSGELETADAEEDFYFDAATPTPKAVLALQDCDADENTPAHRKAFAGGYIFAIKCASNNENFIETLIFSEAEDGADGWLLKFPKSPRNKDVSDTISNIRWYPKTDEIGEIFVDRESPPICRTESRWQLEGKKRKPRLVFMRETRDCEGRGGWVVVVNKK
ncbi:hypothetical protein [Methyloceanibacter sp.]|uniref:hypothetical protein n=1 Tax=Methyloceanibacter sp. TaxID=1965321 RepID=UPI002D57BD05|nr:hypothetical protein [Methyloceanibacter sp.]HZP10424.1 hypothetical protein [Methyloceanibacter sp.]